MMRNPRPEGQLRRGNEPLERKPEGKSRPYEQKTAYKAGWMDEVAKNAKSDTSSRVHKVDADGAGRK